MNSLNSGIDQGRMSPAQTNLCQQHSSDDRRLSPSSLNMDVVDRPGSRFSDCSRPTSPTSPSHRVDVLHGVESGMDTEPEPDAKQDEDDVPPAPPPKESKDIRSTKQLRFETARGSGDSEHATSLSDEDEEVQVERTSTTTYIAPALPPIQISMNAADFSDLLKSIDGPFKSFDQLTKLSELFGLVTDEDADDQVSVFEYPGVSGDLATHKPFPFPTSPSPSPDEELSKKKAALGQESTRRLVHSPNSCISSGSSGMPVKRSISDSNSPAVNGESSSPRSSLDSRSVSQPSPSRARSSSESGHHSHRSNPRLILTVPGVEIVKPPRPENEEVVTKRLQEVLSNANDHHASYVLEHTKTQHTTLKGKLDNIRHASQQYMDGLTVAQVEYDRDVKAKRDAEAEVTRLRVLLSGQAVRLSAITSDSKRADLQRQLSEELSNNLSGLERDVSELKVERYLTLAKVEELSASKSSPNLDPSTDAPLSRTFSVRFDNIKSQYSRELVPLTEQKEILNREVAELKALREQFLEETASLSARNEELAQLHHQYIRQMETAGVDTTRVTCSLRL
ncbi:hypothetical protein NEOLEDRAFT_1184394 [Neolentinus lepideus HHB14362 ss-1]|uniref:Uncharacterized protein n=1 Tax=Neolentinus lepideus HHB14362 ss-1 TaxID=1314782 RepID=A0A165MG44_9AGAM|nr:hypothetical protein NEOLEDRAFT_1184394 [Neolentinus lepideus HHB14362 ss-1]